MLCIDQVYGKVLKKTIIVSMYCIIHIRSVDKKKERYFSNVVKMKMKTLTCFALMLSNTELSYCCSSTGNKDIDLTGKVVLN